MMSYKSIIGQCTVEGSLSYKKIFKDLISGDFYKETNKYLTLSSIGIGTYKGDSNDKTDFEWSRSISTGLSNGINVIDTAIKYRQMRSEKLIGKVLKKLIDGGKLEREQVFISTKGGLISIPENVNINKYLKYNLIDKRKINEKDIYNNICCFDPLFINQEIDKSLSNLGLQTVDCYFLHNPELIFLNKRIDKPYNVFYDLFEVMENRVQNGSIASYGIASWNGFRRRNSSPVFINLKKIKDIAEEVGGINNNFNFIELPLSVGMPFIYNLEIGTNHKRTKLLNKIKEYGLDIFSSASLYEGHLAELFTLQRLFGNAGLLDSDNNESPANVSFPLSENSISQLFGLLINLKKKNISLFDYLMEHFYNFDNIYISSLHAVRSLGCITTALAGMENTKYLKDHLKLTKVNLNDHSKTKDFWKLISGNEKI